MSDATRFSLDRIKTGRLTLNSIVTNELLKERNMNISTFDEFTSMNTILPETDVKLANIENPLTLPNDILKNVNNYRFIYKNPSISFFGEFTGKTNIIKDAQGKINKDTNNKKETSKEETSKLLTATSVSASLFNPLFNVQIVGMSENVPLLQDSLNDPTMKNVMYDKNIDDCSVRELVRLSHIPYDTVLGQARYRYSDFMYCKDLGKVPNNHLITLRKFATPVGDQIFKYSVPHRDGTDDQYSFETPGDIGRLITWFGTEDNKLESILKYNYKSSWKELKSQIQEIPSKENDDTRGPIGMILNSLPSSDYVNKMANNKHGGTHNLYNKLGTMMYDKGFSKIPIVGKMLNSPDKFDNNQELDSMSADKNKVYTPLNTVQDTHLPEGILTMSQDISLTFSYKMRGYDNINQKSAMLDLIGNILEVTYRRGHFWGGARRFIGPAPNVQGWKKTQNIINGTWDKIGGFFSQLGKGDFQFGDLLSSISGAAEQFVDGIKNMSIDKWKSAFSNILNFKGGKEGGGAANTMAGQLSNMLGKPAMYAMDSLLKADNVGLWHLTIGNPKNPIMAIGNLILEDASIEQSGPLGIDDFPTELKVTVKLKHGRSRDLTEIAKMYTKGLNSIYYPTANNKDGQFVPNPFNSSKSNINGVIKVDEHGNPISDGYAETLNEITVTERRIDKNTGLPSFHMNDLIIEETDMALNDSEPIANKNIDDINKLCDTNLITSESAFVAMFNQTNEVSANAIFKELSIR